MIDPDIRMIASDDADARRLSAALAAVTPPAIVAETDSFNDHLRRALHHDRSARRRWLGPVIGLSSLAALIALALFMSTLFTPQRASAALVWADVVKALGQVDYVHVISYWDGADRWNHGSKIDRNDNYYRHPGLWRGQGWGCIHFLTPKGEWMYDVEKRKFVDPKSVMMKPLNVEEAKRFHDGPLLDSVLNMIFRGKAPQPMQVSVGARELAGDLELFEYTPPNEPNEVVRIWVAKTSRLPIRVDLVDRRDESGIFSHLEFGPQVPAESFDAEAFARTIESKQLTRPEDIFRVGLP